MVCARAYHCLFMYNMLIRPTEEELAGFGKPDFTIFNAGAFPVNRHTSYMSSSTSVDLNMRWASRPLTWEGSWVFFVLQSCSERCQPADLELSLLVLHAAWRRSLIMPHRGLAARP